MITTLDAPCTVPDPMQPTEELEMMDGLRALLYHGVPTQICYALARAEIRSLEQVRAQTREELLDIKRIGIDSALRIEKALDAIELAEAEGAIACDVYGCRAGRRCRVATEDQRATFEPMIAARLAGWRASHPPRSER